MTNRDKVNALSKFRMRLDIRVLLGVAQNV